jgi:hypothetical protein
MEFYKDKGFQKLFAIFFLVFTLTILFHEQFTEWEVDAAVILVGNVVLFATSLLTLSIFGKAKRSKTPHGFTRNVYAAFVVKFFILITAAMLYFYFSDQVSIRAVFVCLGLYLVYHFMGASHAARVVHHKKAGQTK